MAFNMLTAKKQVPKEVIYPEQSLSHPATKPADLGCIKAALWIVLTQSILFNPVRAEIAGFMPVSTAAASSPWTEGFRSKYIFEKKRMWRHALLLHAFKCMFVHHSAQHQDNLKDAHKYWLWKHKSGNPEDAYTEYTNLSIALLWSLMPSQLPQWDIPLHRKKKVSVTWANYRSSLRQVTFRWPKQMIQKAN